jgi:hypothetical protein
VDIAQRRAFFAEQAGDSRIAVFVSVGGNLPSTGGRDLLTGRSGLLMPEDAPDGSDPDSGLILTFLSEGVPVVRILNVKDLAAKTGLPYDPQPWPQGTGLMNPRGRATPLLLAFPLLGLASAFLVKWRMDAKAARK